MSQKILTGILLDERVELSLTDISQACACSVEWIVELVDEGILEPAGQEQHEWQFTGTSLLKARTAMRLQHDLNVNLAGIALALDLMEEIETMRERLRRVGINDDT